MSGPRTKAILPLLPGKLALAGNVIANKPIRNPRTNTLLVRSRFMFDTPNFSWSIAVEPGATFQKIGNPFNAKWVTDRSHLNHNSSWCDFSNLRKRAHRIGKQPLLASMLEL